MTDISAAVYKRRKREGLRPIRGWLGRYIVTGEQAGGWVSDPRRGTETPEEAPTEELRWSDEHLTPSHPYVTVTTRRSTDKTRQLSNPAKRERRRQSPAFPAAAATTRHPSCP